MSATCYGSSVNDQDRDELLAKQQAIVDAEKAVEAALVERNDYMRTLKQRYGRGIVSEMARVVGLGRVTVSDLVNTGGPGSGRRQPNRNRSRSR